jgi:hypothetical protein
MWFTNWCIRIDKKRLTENHKLQSKNEFRRLLNVINTTIIITWETSKE